MDKLTSSDFNANDDDDRLASTTVSSSYNAAQSTTDRDQRHRARYGFGFKPPQGKPGRPGPGSRAARPTAMSAAGDIAAADVDERPSVNGEAGHVANGVGDGRASAPIRGPPAGAAKKRQKDALDVQATTGRTKQSALRRPVNKKGNGSSGNLQQQQQQRVVKATTSAGAVAATDNSAQMLNGGHSRSSASLNGRRGPSSDKSVKLLVNYRSTNDPHAPLQSAYGNRDFFGPSSNPASNREAVDAAVAGCALDAPHSGKEEVRQSACSAQSRLQTCDGVSGQTASRDSDVRSPTKLTASSPTKPSLVIVSGAPANMTSLSSSVPAAAADRPEQRPLLTDVGRNDVVVLERTVHRQFMSEMDSYRTSLLHLQQVLLQQDVDSSGDHNQSQCTMCVQQLATISTLQQENTRLSEKVSSLNHTVDEKNRTIELLRQQMAQLHVVNNLASASGPSSHLQKPCQSVSHQSDNHRLLLAERVSVNLPRENIETADSAPVHLPSVTEGSVFTNCSVESSHACRRQISRFSSSDSTECVGSMFDYHSTHPSVDSGNLDDTFVGCVSPDVNVDGKTTGDVICEEEEQLTNVFLPQLAQVTANTAVHGSMSCQFSTASGASKSELLPAASGLPSAAFSSRMQSRLPAPRSRGSAPVASRSHINTSKPDQLANGLTLNNVAVSSASISASSKVGPSRFH